jgi:YfaZ precursor
MLSRLSRTAFLLIVFVFAAGTAVAQQTNDARQARAEVALSNDTLQLRYLGNGGAVAQGSRIGGSFFLSEERDIVLSGAMLFPADIDVGIGALSILVGPQVYAALLEDENSDVMSVALGTELRLLLNRRLGLAVSGQAFYGPDILTFGSADSLTDLSARVELNVAERVTAFGGMRWFEFDLTEGGGERTLQEEIFVGVGYRF